MIKLTCGCALLLAVMSSANAEETIDTDQPVECGVVRWQRDLAEASKASRESGRPVLVLFQEIPGCATCRNFGTGPLSHPLLVEAIEDLFVPVLVYNNRAGEDKKLLTRFEEPAWNNPVVRFVGADGEDIIPRKDRIWTTHGIASRMVEALEKAERDVPKYLELVVEETLPQTETAVFRMGCYYQGEKGLGAIDGVLTTRPGWLDGHEVVEVVYDPVRTRYADLVAKAFAAKCANLAYATTDKQLKAGRETHGEKIHILGQKKVRDARSSENKVYLSKTPYRDLNLTPLQKTKINAALGNRADPKKWLSPRQLARLQNVSSKRRSSGDR